MSTKDPSRNKSSKPADKEKAVRPARPTRKRAGGHAAAGNRIESLFAELEQEAGFAMHGADVRTVGPDEEQDSTDKKAPPSPEAASPADDAGEPSEPQAIQAARAPRRPVRQKPTAVLPSQSAAPHASGKIPSSHALSDAPLPSDHEQLVTQAPAILAAPVRWEVPLPEAGSGEGKRAAASRSPIDPAAGDQLSNIQTHPDFGLLEIVDDTPGRVWTADEQRLVEQVAGQLSLALENARLFQQVQGALAETESLYLASAELNTAGSYTEILAALRRHTLAGAGAHRVSLALFDQPWTQHGQPHWVDILSRWISTASLKDRRQPASRNPVGSDDTVPSRYPLGEQGSALGDTGPFLLLLRPDAPLLVEDVNSDPRVDQAARLRYLQRFGARSLAIFPIVVGGQWIGFLHAAYPAPRTFPDAGVRRALTLINQAAIAVQNLRSLELAEQRAHEAQQRSEELALINRVVAAVVSSPDLRQVLDTLAGELMNVFDLRRVSVALRDGDGLNVITQQPSSESSASSPAVGSRISIRGSSSLQQIFTTRKPLALPATAGEGNGGSGTIVLAPLLASGEGVGLVVLEAPGAGFAPQDMALAETLIGQVSTAIQNANLFEQIQFALAETETLYRASAGLNAAQTYDEILTILRSGTILGKEGVAHASLHLFDRPWEGKLIPGESAVTFLDPIARWSPSSRSDLPGTQAAQATQEPAPPPGEYIRPTLPRLPLPGQQVLRPDEPTIIPDAAALAKVDPRLDETARSVYIDILGARGLAWVPLVVTGQWIGQAVAIFDQPISPTPAEIRRLMSLAGQAAVAVQNLRLYGETRRRAAQLETAAEIARDTSGTLALDVLLQRAVNSIRDRYGFYHASIFLVDETGQNATVRESTGQAGEEMKRLGHRLPVGSRSIIGHVTGTGEPLVINNVAGNPIHRPNPLLPETRAEIGIPLKIGNRVIGALDVQSTQADAFGEDDTRVLGLLADQIAVAVDNARTYELAQKAVLETRRRVQELSVLFNVSQALASAPMQSVEIASIVAQRFIEVMSIPECSISLLDPKKGELVTLSNIGRSRSGDGVFQYAEEINTVYPLVDYPATTHVIETLLPLVIQADDPSADPAELAYMQHNHLATLAIIPMAVKGQAIGIVELEAWDAPRSFTSEQLNLCLILANAAAVALENARLYEEQRRSAEKLRELDRLKSQFLANMSHELRTPLNSIIGFSRVILKGIDGPITELQFQDLNAIYNAGQHLLSLINAVLDISKIEAGKMELNFEDEVDLGQVIQSVTATATGLLRDKPVELVRLIPPGLPPVRADVTRIRQVLINFLSNAAKFTERGSITIETGVQAGLREQPEVFVKVIDTGIGITPEDQRKLFLPFSQVDDSPIRKTGGSGLGLSISRLLIELHGGRIGVESQVGHGSTFYFTLPLGVTAPSERMASPGNPAALGQAAVQTAEPDPDPAPVPQADQIPAVDSIPSKVILAVDDDPQVLDLYRRYLSPHGYTFLPLNDPAQAHELARQQQPFAVLLDIRMPGMDGWQVLRTLKDDPDTRSIPVILCTIEANRAAGLSLGAVDYLMKPILEVDLLSSLERLDKDRGEYIRSNPPILVISDDPEALHHLAALLQAMGRTSVRLAQGGAAGLVALAEARDTPRVRCPQAVILDLPLGAGSQDTLPPGENGFSPEVNGFTLLETLCTESVFGEAIAFTFTGSDLTEAQKDRLEQLLEARHTPLSTGRSADIVLLEGRLTGQATPLLRRLQQALQILEPGTQTSHGPVQESGIQNTDTSSAKSSPRIWNL